MELIAECGYSALQTSPCTQPKDYTYDGVVGTDVGTPGVGGSGTWWKLYQPVTFSVCDNGETWLDTKEELESMCVKAEEYGIKVIVDVVVNHMGNITGCKNSLDDVSPQVGECETYVWASNEVAAINHFNNRMKNYSDEMGADGTTDEVSGNTFTVSGGTLSGTITSEYGIAVIYQNVMPNPSKNYPVQV